jgi:hypothetical protein
MGHRFDDLCKRLVVDDSLSRRSLLRGLMASLAVSSAPEAAKVFAQAPRPPVVPVDRSPETCVRRTSAGKTVEEVSLAKNGITYQRQLMYDAATQIGTTTITVSRGQALIFRVEGTTARRGTGDTSVVVQYGPEVEGVRSATIITQDGKSFRGSIDRRTVTSSSSPHSMSDVTFADGAPAPKIVMDAALAPVVGALATEASKLLANCQTVPSVVPKRIHRFRETSSPGSGWYEPGESYDSPDCTNCSNNCETTAENNSGIKDWYTYVCGPPCIAGAVAAYNAIWIACWASCQVPGGGCCPVPCGGAFICCGRNDNCFHSDLCCPGSMVVCKDVCCGPGVTTCAADGFCGCPTGQLECGNNCCPTNTTCCGGQCCPTGTTTCCGNICCATGSTQCCGNQCCPTGAPCLNNVCCPSPSHVCPGSNTCCPPFNVCCGSTCCGLNEVCLTDARTGTPQGCCPASQACGVGGENPVCCPAGQMCIDQHDSTCAPCPVGQVSCASGGNAAIVCCAPGVNCCNGTCCKPQEICCTNIRGGPRVFGCHAESLCIG